MGDEQFEDTFAKTPDQSDGPASIQLAQITSVNVKEYTVDVMTTYTHKPLVDIPFSSPLCHRDHRGGMYFMPEAEAYCYVCECQDGTAFVLGFITNPVNVTPQEFDELEGGKGLELIAEAADIGPSFKGARAPMEPGDIFLGTIDGNSVVVRRGGMVQIGSTSLAQRIYLPVENVIRDYFQRYQAYSPVGEIEWGHAILVEGEKPTQQGGYLAKEYLDDNIPPEVLEVAEETPVLVKYNIKDLCQEDVTKGKYTVELRVGRLTEDQLDPEEDPEHVFGQGDHKASDDARVKKPVKAADGDKGILDEKDKTKGVLSFTIYQHDKDTDDKKRVRYVFQLSRDGDNLIFTRGNIHVEVSQTVYANIREGAKIVYGDKGGSGDSKENKQSVIELLQDNDFKAFIKNMVIECMEGYHLISPKEVYIEGEDVVQLGKKNQGGTDQQVVLLDDLATWLTTSFSCMTAWGPSGPVITAPTQADIASKSVKAKKG